MIATGINAMDTARPWSRLSARFPKDGRMGQIWSNNPIELLKSTDPAPHLRLGRDLFPPARPSSICSVPSSREQSFSSLGRPTTPTTV